MIKASRIIAVDTNVGKEAWAMKMGATDFVNPSKLPEGTKIQDYLIDITDGGLDYTFDCTGNVSVPHCWNTDLSQAEEFLGARRHASSA